MADQKKTTEEKTQGDSKKKDEPTSSSKVESSKEQKGKSESSPRESKFKRPTKKKFFNKKGGKRRTRGREPRSEFDQKIVSLRRVTRVVAGGRRFSFSVGIVIGDRKGSVGVGQGKATDTALAIEKAVRDAKKNLITPKLTNEMSVPFDVKAKFCASEVLIIPAKGRGLKAGGSMRTVLDLLGAKDLSGKILSRSKNHINNAEATIKALSKIGLKKRKKKTVKTPPGPKKRKIVALKK